VKGLKVMTVLMLVLLAIPFLGSASAWDSYHGDIIAFRHGTTTKSSCPPGYRLGCLTSGTFYTLYIDFYYIDTSDHNQMIHYLYFQRGDGSDGSSYHNVGFTVTWAYSYDGITWTPYSGTGDIDVPYSGKSHSGDIVGSEPHVIVRVTFPVTGSLGDKFYYRVYFKYGCDCYWYGKHYFWYEICDIPDVSESPMELPLMALLGAVAVYMARRRRLGVVKISMH